MLSQLIQPYIKNGYFSLVLYVERMQVGPLLQLRASLKILSRHFNWIWHSTKRDLIQFPKRAAYRSSFQESGTPARHQWLQSTSALPRPAYTDGWPSFLSWVSNVMSSKYAGFFILLIMLLKSSSAGRVPLGYSDPFTGPVCPMHCFALGSPHSAPLTRGNRRNEKRKPSLEPAEEFQTTHTTWTAGTPWKKILVFKGSMFSSTHFAHVVMAIP